MGVLGKYRIFSTVKSRKRLRWKRSPTSCSKRGSFQSQARLPTALRGWVLSSSRHGDSSASLGNLSHCSTAPFRGISYLDSVFISFTAAGGGCLLSSHRPPPRSLVFLLLLRERLQPGPSSGQPRCLLSPSSLVRPGPLGGSPPDPLQSLGLGAPGWRRSYSTGLAAAEQGEASPPGPRRAADPAVLPAPAPLAREDPRAAVLPASLGNVPLPLSRALPSY